MILFSNIGENRGSIFLYFGRSAAEQGLYSDAARGLKKKLDL